jgi:hypothetical protein
MSATTSLPTAEYLAALEEARKHTAREAKAQIVAGWITSSSNEPARDWSTVIADKARTDPSWLDTLTSRPDFPPMNRPSLTTWLRVAAILYGQDDR